MKPSVKGSINSKNPVALFKTVCMANSFLTESNPQTRFEILMNAITTIQAHSQPGNCINGSIFAKHTAANTQSASVSNLAPNSPADFVFLAIAPSAISVIPQYMYMM
jgi:hypothetical protein